MSKLKLFKEKSQVMDKEFLRYFKENKNITNNNFLRQLEQFKLPPTIFTGKVNLCPKANFISVFNEPTMRYNFYSSKSKINFDIYSPQVANQHFAPIKKDSFNPYGVNDSKKSIVIGVFNYFLQAIQK